MPVMRHLNVGGTTYDTVGEASVTQVLSSGTKIATVSIDGTSTDLYAPEGGSSVDPATAAPSMDGTAAVGSSVKYAREDHVHPTDTSRQATLVSGTNIKTVNSTSLLGSGDIAIAGLPSVTASDNGKVLQVSNGAWAAATPSGGGSVSYSTQAVSIPTSAWSNGSATVNASAVTTTSDVIVSPAPASTTDWASAGVYCSGQGSGTLTLGCSSTPSSSLTANVMAFEGGSTVVPSGYNITVSLTNPSNPSYFGSCTIYRLPSADTTSDVLGTIDSPTGSAQVFVDESDYGMRVSITTSGYLDVGDPLLTGGVEHWGSNVQGQNVYYDFFGLTGDGTITFDGIDYDD